MRLCRWSEPWVRVEATSIARPVPASQAEKASIKRGVREDVVIKFSTGHVERAMYRDSIMLSRHKRAEIRWVRWKANPRQLKVKVE